MCVGGRRTMPCRHFLSLVLFLTFFVDVFWTVECVIVYGMCKKWPNPCYIAKSAQWRKMQRGTEGRCELVLLLLLLMASGS